MEEIKASDLMVDNLIYRKYWNPEPGNERYSYSVEKVIGIYKDTIYCTPIDRKEVFKLKDVYGIPLTEDILYKVGFEKDEIEGIFYKDSCILAKGKYRWSFFNDGLSGGELTSIEYLHELQNIFRILTIDIDIEL